MTNIKLVIFDLDDTLITRNNEDENILVPDTMSVLEYLKQQKIRIAIASHNNETLSIIKRLGIYNYFDTIAAYYDNTWKYSHVKSICKLLKISYNETLFCDDFPMNTRYVNSQLGTKIYKVNCMKGIKLDDIINLINNYEIEHS